MVNLQRNIDDGNLIPDDVMIDVMKSRLSEDDCKAGFILDGFPQNDYRHTNSINPILILIVYLISRLRMTLL